MLGFAQNPQETYEELSPEFLSTFRFERLETCKNSKKSKAPSLTFVCKFTMRGENLIVSLDEFGNAIFVANTGSWDETGADSNVDLVNFCRSILVNYHDRLNRGKFTHIQHSRLRYFALFLARGFLARDNNSA